MVSPTRENYLKSLYYLHQKSEEISLSDLGEKLQVSKPSANSMIKKLQDEKLVIYEKYKPIKMTSKGKKLAAFIIRRHRLSEIFLLQIMKFGWEEVHDIAEELEHIRFEKLFDRMDELLGYPTTDPHGSAIPDKNGNFRQSNYKILSDIKIGHSVKIKALLGSTPDFLHLLTKKSIHLNSEITVIDVEKFDGTYTVSYDNFSNVMLSKLVCDRLLVEEINL